jgi:uncharacterized protein YjbI with pentapeptide repeats
MSKSGDTEQGTSFKCDCDPNYRTACEGAEFYADQDGKKFCVFHYPGSSKATAFEKALKNRLEAGKFLFSGFFFPTPTKFEDFEFTSSADFERAEFNRGVDFNGAKFLDVANFIGVTFKNGATFKGAEFHDTALFNEVGFDENIKPDFENATFETLAEFKSAVFKAGADFSFADFNAETHFTSAIFGEAGEAHSVSFESTTFAQDVDFQSASFYAETDFTETRFGGGQEDAADFAQTRFERPVRFRNAVFTAHATLGQVVFKGEVDLTNAIFKEEADLSNATFNSKTTLIGVHFGGNANFTLAKFLPPPNTEMEVTFKGAVFFGKAGFEGACFGGDQSVTRLSFENVRFEEQADFSAVTFTDQANFLFASFKASAYFRNTVFLSPPSFSFAAFEKSEGVFFHSLTLWPSCFINVDARKFNFTDVRWKGKIEEELARLYGHPYRLLSIAYRQLAVNAEENHRYKEASIFRFASMDVRRLEKCRGWNVLTLDWWYWLLSGYGEKIWRAAVALTIILVLFGIAYCFTGFRNPESMQPSSKISVNPSIQGELLITPLSQRPEIGRTLAWRKAIIYSLEVSLLQRPEPSPMTVAAHLLVALQTVVGPLIAALLALAVRRKFMR